MIFDENKIFAVLGVANLIPDFLAASLYVDPASTLEAGK